MQIRKDSFVYKVAYKRLFEDKEPHGQVSLCRFFWTFAWSLFVVWPSQAIIIGMMVGAVYIMLGLDGRYLNTNADAKVIPYWPTIAGWRVRLWVILPIGFGVWWLSLHGIQLGIQWLEAVKYLWPTILNLIMGVGAIAGAIIFIVGGLIAVFVAVDRIKRLGHEDGGVIALTKAFIKAKKVKICPLITFVDPSPNTK